MQKMTSLTSAKLYIALPLAALALAACDVDAITNKTTTRHTTVNIEYQEGSLTTEEAQERVRSRCGEGEVLSVSTPEPLEKEGWLKLNAQCLATYDHDGNLIPNET